MIQEIENEKIEKIAEIQKNLQIELRKLQIKYEVTDRIGSSVNYAFILTLVLMCLVIVLSDFTKFISCLINETKVIKPNRSHQVRNME